MYLRRKISSLFIGLIIVIFLAGILFFNYKNDNGLLAEAALTDNVYGFAWSENIGWISFNSNNCDVDGNGMFEGGAEGAPAGCPTSGVVVPYGVNINITSKELSGFAWSKNIGWISFNGNVTGKPPRNPYRDDSQNYIAKMDNNGILTGWARAISACKDDNWDNVGQKCNVSRAGDRAGDWDGWIKLRKDIGDSGPDYGVSVSGGDFLGWAWGSDVVGWVSFNSKNCDLDNNTFLDSGACRGDNMTIPVINYKVSVLLPPSSAPVPTFSSTTSTSTTLSWGAVSGATNYKVYNINEGGNVCENIFITNCTDNTLTPNTLYTFIVSACNAAGCTDSSPASITTLVNASITPPIAPVLTSGTITSTSITIAWGAVPNITYYKAFNIDKSATVPVCLGISTVCTDSGLLPETEYTFKASACNAGGCTDSNEINITTLSAASVAPTAPFPVVSSLSPTSITISWGDVNGATYYNTYNFNEAAFICSGSTDTFCTDNSLAANTPYTFMVSACNTIGCTDSIPISFMTPAVTVILPPSVAPYVVSSSITESSISMQWNPVARAVSYNIFNTNEGSYACEETSGTICTDNNLSSGTTYTFIASACNEGGCTGASFTFTTLNTPPVVELNAMNAIDYCLKGIDGDVKKARFSWNYTDAEDLNMQKKYRLIITRSDGRIYDSGEVLSSSTDVNGSGIYNENKCSLGSDCKDFINYGGYTYTWTVEAWDSGNLSSGIKQSVNYAGANFGPTPLHIKPEIAISCPSKPEVIYPRNGGCSFDFSLMETIEFSDKTICHDNSGSSVSCTSVTWEFGDADSSSSTDRDTSFQYSEAGSYVVRHTVGDGVYSCSTDYTIKIDESVSPSWKEVTPAN